MKEISVGKRGQIAMVDDENFERLSRYNWRLNKGYAYTTICGYAVRMHQLVFDCPDGFITDHRNRNKLDNQRRNLRRATHSQNGANQALRADNVSGYKGVTWNKQMGKWKAQIRNAGARLFLGYFEDAQAAAKAYDVKARELFGEFACLNLANLA
ncbi:MAG TPA: HNH endonuclease [Sphingomicrobium sp.]|nr:HNH endonuclease [Sphingomicrobium sp.]